MAFSRGGGGGGGGGGRGAIRGFTVCINNLASIGYDSSFRNVPFC